MTSPAFLLLLPLLGVSFGYEPSSDSDTGYDYTVQVEPELLEQMQRGNAEAIEANIPAEVAPIRRIRIVVGSDALPKRLRPSPVARTTYRQDVDSVASPSIDLLAQTGPAGGFGRNSTGFNSTQTRPSSPPPSTVANGPTTVPPMYTQYPSPTTTSVQGQLDAGFQAAEQGLTATGQVIADTANQLGASGQKAFDDVQQYVNSVVAPPANPTVNSTSAPMQAPVGTTALPNPTSATSPDAFDTTRYGAGTGTTVTQAPINSPPPGWTSNQNERSVLTSPTVTAPPESYGLTQAERDYLNRIEADRQRQQQSVAGPERSTTFPQQPQMQQLPDPNQNSDVVVSLGNRPRTNAEGNFGSMQSGPTGGPVLTSPQTGNNNWMVPTNDRSNFDSIGAPTIGNISPITNTAQIAPPKTTPNDDVASWLEGQDANKPLTAGGSSGKSSTPVWLLGWTIAVGSVVTNLFQWLNIVDLRNKYRVALRRNSPNFARSMAA